MAKNVLSEEVVLYTSDQKKVVVNVKQLADEIQEAARKAAISGIVMAAKTARSYSNRDMEELEDVLGDKLYRILCEGHVLQMALIECINQLTDFNFTCVKNAQIGKETLEFEDLAKGLGIEENKISKDSIFSGTGG